MPANRRVPAQERHSDADGLVRVPWLTFYRDQQDAIASAPQAVPSGIVRLTGQTATIGTTAIPTAALPAGLYRVSGYLQVVTPAGVAGSAQLTLTWTRNGVVQTFTGTLMNGNTTATHQIDGLPLIHVDGGTPVSYSVGYASNPAAALVYSLDLVLELVSAD